MEHSIKNQNWDNRPKIRMLHYLLSVSDKETVAHCLDIDTVATASSQKESIKILSVLVKAHLEHSIKNQNWDNLTPAPEEYWEKYAKAKFGGVEPIANWQAPYQSILIKLLIGP